MMGGPKSEVALHEWGALNQEMPRRQIDVFEDLTGAGAHE